MMMMIYRPQCLSGVVMRSVASVCVSVRLSVYVVLTFESIGLESSFMVRRCVFEIFRSASYIKVKVIE